MELHIAHKTTYAYENPVVLNTHTIFLKPLQRPYLHIGQYHLEVLPIPGGLVERSSIEGNPFFQTWFNQATDRLEINASFDVTIQLFNPFSFIIDLDFVQQINPASPQFFHYTPAEQILLYACLQTFTHHSIYKFANAVFLRSPENPIAYLMELTATVHENWKHIIRQEENIWNPEQTFEKNEGSCRDLSWMLIHMLRMQGLAARFVSGYAFNPELNEGHELHAWVETYLPGAGWIGMDPSLGLFTDQNYIPLACSSEAQNTLPVHGTYAGSGISTLETYVEISYK